MNSPSSPVIELSAAEAVVRRMLATIALRPGAASTSSVPQLDLRAAGSAGQDRQATPPDQRGPGFPALRDAAAAPPAASRSHHQFPRFSSVVSVPILAHAPAPAPIPGPSRPARRTDARLTTSFPRGSASMPTRPLLVVVYAQGELDHNTATDLHKVLPAGRRGRICPRNMAYPIGTPIPDAGHDFALVHRCAQDGPQQPSHRTVW